MKLTLIRHGLTEGNIRRLYYGAMDLPLLPDGIEALHALRDGGGYPEAERYFTSGMTRTEQTFAALYGDRPHGTLPGMQEMRFGEFEGKTYADLKDDPAFRAWCSGDYENNVCPGGESWNGLTDRALQALAPILAQEKDTVIVAHGGVIGGLMYRWFPGMPHRFVWTPDPGHGYQITFEDGKPVSYCTIPEHGTLGTDPDTKIPLGD